jgi:hypothetical protein
MARAAVSAFIAAGLLAFGSLPAAAEDELPFIGTWDCEVATFTFTEDSYNNGSEDLPIQEIQEGTDGSYTLFFADDYIITLSGFTGDAMGWFSPASGDSFQCTLQP